MRRADHSTRRVLPTAVCRYVSPGHLTNEAVLVAWGSFPREKDIPCINCIYICILLNAHEYGPIEITITLCRTRKQKQEMNTSKITTCNSSTSAIRLLMNKSKRIKTPFFELTSDTKLPHLFASFPTSSSSAYLISVPSGLRAVYIMTG